MAERDLRLEDWVSAGLKSVSADFCHALILFCKGKALKIVLKKDKDLRLGEHCSTSTCRLPMQVWLGSRQRFCVRSLTVTFLMLLPLSGVRS